MAAITAADRSTRAARVGAPFTENSASAFSGYRRPRDIIVMAVRWYLAYPLSDVSPSAQVGPCIVPLPGGDHCPCTAHEQSPTGLSPGLRES